MKENPIKGQIGKYRYLSFDLFDTLVIRALEDSSKVFDLVEEKYNACRSHKIRNFKRIRMAAEKKARKKIGWNEVDIDQIYIQLPYKEETCNLLKKIEKQMEINISMPNPDMVELVQWARENGRYIIITTDMYLDRETITAILEKVNIPYDTIFLSSEVKKTKEKGQLFEYMLEKLGIEKADVIHIGDNEWSDIKVPESMGITSVKRIKREIMSGNYIHLSPKVNASSDCFYGFIKNSDRIFGKILSEYRIGYTVIGPLLYEFCYWIHEIKEEKQLSQLYFVAREGYFIKKCYDIMYPEHKEQSKYIHLNKNLLRLPSLEADDISEVLLSSLSTSRTFTWEEIFAYLKISDQKVLKTITSRYGLEGQVVDRGSIQSGQYQEIFQDLKDQMKEKIREQKEMLLEYLDSLGIQDNKIGLINNSINGNGQFLLEKILKANNINYSITGIQFVNSKQCKERLGGRVEVWLERIGVSGREQYEFSRNALVLEHLLFGAEGTACCFTRKNKKVTVVCSGQGSELQNNKIVETIQTYAVKFVESYKKMDLLPVPQASLSAFLYMTRNPYKEDAVLLSNLYDDDVDGGRKINDLSIPFRFSYMWRNNIYSKISWMQGYLSGCEKNEVYIKIFQVRLWLTYYLKRMS